MTLCISSRDSQNTSFLVNGTHLGLMSSIAQNTHVQTSARPVQMIVALRDGDIASGNLLVYQKQLISAWQEFLQIISRQSSGDINLLLQQYRLFPDWLVIFDQSRLQAWLPGKTGFYLLRDQELRRLRPVSPRVEPDQAASHPDDPRQYYNITLSERDQLFVLPPDIFELFTSGEATEVLLGLRQLPAKVGDLIRTARLRGYNEDFTWLAIQISLLRDDYQPGQDRAKKNHASQGFFPGLLARSSKKGTAETHSESVSVEYPDDQAQSKNRNNPGFFGRWNNSRWLPVVFGTAVLILVLAAAAFMLLSNPPDPNPAETTAETTTIITTVTMTPTPSPTVQPTVPPTPTPAPQLVVSVRRLNLRSQPTRNSDLILTLENGDLLYQLAEASDGWVMVRTIEGHEGYVFFDFVARTGDSN